jgi:crotonyl-CoA carboxylase/reductase
VDTPEPADDEVLVYVMAAGINYNNVWAGLGIPVNVIGHRATSRASRKTSTSAAATPRHRLQGRQGRQERQSRRRGGDPLRHVEPRLPLGQGRQRSHVRPTFRIWGYETNWGSFAQFTRVQAHQCMPKPKHMTWEQAASYMLVGATAYRMLLRLARARDEARTTSGADLGRGRRARLDGHPDRQGGRRPFRSPWSARTSSTTA